MAAALSVNAAKLEEFYKVFENGLASGLTRDAAAKAAKAETGL